MGPIRQIAALPYRIDGDSLDAPARILLVTSRGTGRWVLPKGKLYPGEHARTAAKREVLEETGLEVTVERLTGVYKNLTHGIVALVYRCRPAGGGPHATEEAREICWMTREEVQSAMVPAFAVRVLDAFADKTQSRAHDGVDLLLE